MSMERFERKWFIYINICVGRNSFDHHLSDLKMTDINKTTGKDIAYAVAKAGLGSVPIIGAAATELLTLIITPPMEKRREIWMSEVGEALKELELKRKVDLAGLATNDEFIDIVMQASAFAIKTSEQEKLRSFRNAILNTAAGDAPNTVLNQTFIKILDSFTSWHIRVLKLIDNPTLWFKQNNKTMTGYVVTSLRTLVITAFPDMKDSNELLDLVWSDLGRAGFHNTTQLSTTMSGDDLLANRTTEIGRQFLKFISEV